MSKKILLILKEGTEASKGTAVSIVWTKEWQQEAPRETIGLLVKDMTETLLEAIKNKNVKTTNKKKSKNNRII